MLATLEGGPGMPWADSQTSFGLVLSLFLGSCALFEHGELMCT